MATALEISCNKCKNKSIIHMLNMYSDFFNNFINVQHKGHRNRIRINIINDKEIIDIRPMINHLLNSKNLIGVEVGTWKGKNALCMLKYLDIKKLYLVDSYKSYDDYVDNIHISHDEAYREAKDTLKDYDDKIVFLKDLSENVVDSIPNELDFVYVDGNHNYEYVKKDIEMFWPKIKDGGILSGDDYGLHWPGVGKAVSEFVIDNGLHTTPKRCTTLFEDWTIVK